MTPKIIDAARMLALSSVRAEPVSSADVIASGACTAAEFGAAFASPAVFQRELANRLFADAREAVIQATAGMQSGLHQLCTAFTTYLDYNLSHPALQQLAHVIQFQPEGYELLQRMEIGVALVAQADVQAMGADHVPERARLLTALAVFTVRAEYKARKKMPGMRDALLDLCKLSAGPGLKK